MRGELHLAVGLSPTPHPIPRSQDHQIFLVTKDFVNASKESAADKAAVITKMAAKAAAKQVAAEEQAENKQKAEIKKAKMTKDVAKDAASAQATKEEVPVQIWPGTISDRGPSPGWDLLGRLRPHHRTPSYPPVAPVTSRETGYCGSGALPCFQRRNAWR